MRTGILLSLLIIPILIFSVGSNIGSIGKAFVSYNTESIEKLKGIDFSCKGCNVLFINVELLRADYVGLLNTDKNTTPNIDEFFNKSIIFEQVSAPAGGTLRSNTAVQTAMDGQLVQGRIADLEAKNISFIRRYPAMAEILSGRGYYTININEGMRSGSGAGLDRDFDFYQDFGNLQLIDNSLNFLIQTLNSFEDGPFYLHYHPNTLHQPYQYPLNRKQSVYSSIIKSDRYDSRFSIFMDETQDFFSQPDYPKVAHALYGQQVRYVDDKLPALFQLLNSKFAQNTIIVFYANHGEGISDNGIQNHEAPYQSNVHVPLLIMHPNVKKQIRIDTPVSLIDLAPTIYEMLGVKIQHPIFGISLVPLIKGGEYSREYIYGGNDYDEYVRKDDWKLVIFGGQQKYLYNIKDDPHEETNVIDAYPEIAFELELALKQHNIDLFKFKKANPIM